MLKARKAAPGTQATNDLLASRIKIRSMNFMRGRTFLSLPDPGRGAEPHPKQMKTPCWPRHQDRLPGQRRADRHPYLTETTSGLTYAVDRFKNWPHGAHITLRRGERSRLADYASEVL